MAKTLITEAQYEAFAELAEKYGCYPRPDYSGRGMFGATCLGVDGSSEDLHRFMIAASRLDGFEDIVTRAPSHDAMGKSDIVAYWRSVQVEDYARDGWL